MVVDFNSVGGKVTSPAKLAHVVLRTNNFAKMNQFYKDFLGGRATMEVPDQLSFLTYDDEHHRIAIVAVPALKNTDTDRCGLEVCSFPPSPSQKKKNCASPTQQLTILCGKHVAFTFQNIEELFLAYRQRKAIGIEPIWCVNHGPTISLYYRDPDGNKLETQVDCFNTSDEATAYMMSPEFRENPLGVDVDPEEMIKRIESGESFEGLRTRPNLGPRGLETVPGYGK
jgi:catechol-2,3-dioxygenase